MALNRDELKERVEEEGLVQNYIHLETQLTPQGFDLTVDEIHEIEGKGKIDFSNGEREIPDSRPLKPEKENPDDDYGWWHLEKGTYKIVMNEKVDIPNNLTGFAFPRSSLLRMGVTIENAVWDAGFTGTGSFKLSVDNPDGVSIKENARVNQIVFERISEADEGYSGRYQE